MAEPGYLDLRSDLPFERGAREAVLAAWQDGADSLGINVRYDAALTGIEGEIGDFRLAFGDGSRVAAEHVVLAIGTQGNPRQLDAPGADDPRVQYTLDDPDAYGGEHILVIGAGDAAIENALALAATNRVTILNRKAEFSRAKDSNLQAILAAINDPNVTLECCYGTTVSRVQATDDALGIHLDTPEGEAHLDCQRVIARLGSAPPRAFLESLGIVFSGPGEDAVPELDQHYRSTVPGIHIVGALAGNPLIKQAMNQGHDVLEFIHGHDIEPADQPILEARFAALPFQLAVPQQVERLERLIPMFTALNTLQFRELLIDSDMLASYPPGEEIDRARRRLETTIAPATDERYRPRLTRLLSEGETIHEAGEYGTSFYTILAGEVLTRRALDDGRTIEATLERGEFFGETGLLSGHPRQEQAIAGPGCILMETPRRTMLKLVASNEEVRSGIDWMFTVRELQRHLAPSATKRELRGIAAELETVSRRAGETLYAEGDEARCLFLVRSGGFTLSRAAGSGEPPREQFIDQVRAGRMIGQLALMGDPIRRESAVATVESTAVRVDEAAFKTLMARPDAPVASLQGGVASVLAEHTRMEVRPEAGSAMRFLMDQGLGEATDVLIIDESLCIGCDNCEKACAETHGGISSLARTVGPTFAGIHVPSACRHCVQPHCMKDCPPDALHRAVTGEVFIDDTCIGCGNCQTNCPYGVIRMVETPAPRPGLFGWALFGRGDGPGERGVGRASPAGGAQTPKKAVKCDACIGVPSGPACVSACPTGAAMRLVPGDYVALVEEKQGR